MSNDKLAEALREAAASLRTLERGAMREEYLDDANSVRAYARSRADVAENALQAHAAEAAQANDDAEQLRLCREDWQKVCDVIHPGRHFNPEEIVEKLKAAQAQAQAAEDAAMFAHAVSLGQRYKQRAETAEAELAEAQNTIAAQQGTMGALKRKLALAEGELAALKARIAEAARAYHSSFEFTLDASTLYARATGIPGEETYALVKVED